MIHINLLLSCGMYMLLVVATWTTTTTPTSTTKSVGNKQQWYNSLYAHNNTYAHIHTTRIQTHKHTRASTEANCVTWHDKER